MTYNQSLFVERLKALRKQKSFSQEQLAKAVNVSRAAVGHWELGIRTPDLNTVSLLSEVFNCSISYILGLTDVREDLMSSPFLEAMLESVVPMYVFVCEETAKPRVTWVNNTLLNKLGYTREEFLFLNPLKTSERMCFENLEHKNLLLKDKKSMQSGWIYIDKDGNRLLANQTITEIDTPEQTYFLIIINHLSNF